MGALNQLNGKQIRNSVIINDHIASKVQGVYTGIAEAKLDINWDGHYQACLESKKVLDYVQLNNIAISEGDASVNVLKGAGTGQISLGFSTGAGVKGVIDTQPVIIRDHADGTPVESGADEVFGIISHTASAVEVIGALKGAGANFDATDADTIQTSTNIDLSGSFSVNEIIRIAKGSDVFQAKVSVITPGVVGVSPTIIDLTNVVKLAGTASDITGFLAADVNAYTPAVAESYTIAFNKGTFESPVAVNLPDEFPNLTAIDLLYPARFDLYDVNEAFTMNERFVDGMADVTEIMNLRQLARDMYGSSYSLDNDGAANGIVSNGGQTNGTNPFSVQEHLNRLDAGNTTAGSVDYKVKALRDILNSVSSGDGASEIGLADAGGFYDATTVEGALQEIVNKLQSKTDGTSGADYVKATAVKVGGAESVQGILEDLESRLNSQESGGGAEVTDTHSREVDSANDYFLATGLTPYDSLEERLIAIETVVDSKAGELDTLKTDLASTTDGKGSDMIGFYDAGNLYTGVTVQEALTEVMTEKNQLITDLASTDTSKGASLIGIKLENSQFTATNVEGALNEALDAAQAAQNDIDNLVTLSGVAVDSVNLGTFTGGIIGDSKTVKAALQDIETALESVTNGSAGADHVGITALTNRTGATVQAALEDLDGDLKSIEDWKSANALKIHTHNEEMHVVTALEAPYTIYTTTMACKSATDFFAVYVNGARQLPGTHFIKAQGTGGDATKVVFTFQDNLVETDNIYIEIIKNNEA